MRPKFEMEVNLEISLNLFYSIIAIDDKGVLRHFATNQEQDKKPCNKNLID